MKENKKPSKGGRPKLAGYQKRTKSFRLMFTESDYIYIKYKADEAGLSVNEFCHQAAMNCTIRQRVANELMSAIRDLSGIANNVNQIAHQMHIHGLEVTHQQCVRILAEISTILSTIKNSYHDSKD